MGKGVSKTLWIIVTAVVVFIVALVLLTMVGGPLGSVGSLTEANAICKTVCLPLCIGRENAVPVPYFGGGPIKVGNEIKYCKDLVPTCGNCRS